jgi:hypothetical protein
VESCCECGDELSGSCATDLKTPSKLLFETRLITSYEVPINNFDPCRLRTSTMSCLHFSFCVPGIASSVYSLFVKTSVYIFCFSS